MHTGKDLEVHWVEKGRLSCDSDAPQVGSARSVSASVVKENRRKTNRRKTRPYRIIYEDTVDLIPWLEFQSSFKSSTTTFFDTEKQSNRIPVRRKCISACACK